MPGNKTVQHMESACVKEIALYYMNSIIMNAIFILEIYIEYNNSKANRCQHANCIAFDLSVSVIDKTQQLLFSFSRPDCTVVKES